jgi:regulator of protease activity HflC (stomatin/prohibitin superfamily)
MDPESFSTPPPLPPPPSRFPRRDARRPLPQISLRGPVMSLLVVGLLLFTPMWVWFFWRIEPGTGQIVVLIRKSGEALPTGEILATKPGQKGIQLDVLPEGRYFRNPYTWSWEYHPVTEIPAGRLGVQSRMHGADLEAGQIVAGPGQKGILVDVLGPGTYRVNPYAVLVEPFDAISIRPGHVGVMTSLIGHDVINNDVTDTNRNSLMVGEGVKGVVPQVLDPGTHYLNPYMVNVIEVNLQSQRFEMSGDDAISFLTVDGFNVEVEGTLEFALMREQAALLTHRIGDMDDIIKKIILPRARGFSRIEGSKQPATSYIIGETRQKFQDTLEVHLRERCKEWGVAIKSVLVRNIKVPDEIASIIREREIAVQDAKKFEQQIEQAKSKAELTKQEMLAQQNKAKVEAETAKLKAVIEAQQQQSVTITNAIREFDVAKLDAEAAKFQAAAVLAAAKGEGQVIRLDNEAQASVISNQVSAFNGGLGFARYTFYQQVAPRIGSLLTTDDPKGLGGIFQPLLPDPKARAKEVRP